MVKALTFSGQGSQFPKMGKDIYDAYPEAKQVFQEVDDALEYNLSSIIFSGQEEELAFTVNAQPAIMTTGIAFLRVLQKQMKLDFAKHSIGYVAGHSLGEYTALCAADALSLKDTAILLKKRAYAMSNAVPSNTGGMISLLGADIDTVQEIAKEVSTSDDFCQISNDNSVGQVVLSGHLSALERATKLAKGKGVKLIVPLSVSAPFHCSLMKPAEKAMEQVLQNVNMQVPIVPLLDNVMALPVSSVSEIKDLLLQQITSKVRWRESMLNAGSLGVDTLIELGGNGVLTKLQKRIDKNIKAIYVGDIQALDDLLESGL